MRTASEAIEVMSDLIGKNWTQEEASAQIPLLQIAIYVMVGGGFIGRMYAEQPADAYIDSRVGRRPYSIREINKARGALIAMAKKAGLDPSNLPKSPRWHNLGVF